MNPLPDKSKPIEAQTPDMLARMLGWAEGRGEALQAVVGILWSIKNRVQHPHWWGNTLSSVILKKWQYSSFNGNDPNRAEMMDPLKYDTEATWAKICLSYEEVFVQGVPDPTGGATHYHDKTMLEHKPAWATAPGTKFLCRIGDIYFYKAL
jgi:cell wall hydrolase